jgi:hypothetical protein
MNDSCRRNWRYCFVDHPKYYDKALNSAATIVLINKNVASRRESIVDFWIL